MNTNGQQIEPPDLKDYDFNRSKFPLDQLIPYAGQHVAFSPDGKTILASGVDRDDVDNKLAAIGIHFSQVVHDFIDPLE